LPGWRDRIDGGCIVPPGRVKGRNGGGRQEIMANARLIATAPDLLAVVERLAKRECEYGNGANCLQLPQGVVRSVCLPCKARAALDKTTA